MNFKLFTHYNLINWLLAICLFSLNINALALSGDAANPIDIAADSVEIDQGQNISTYSGQVEASQGSMRLWADHVVVQHQPSRQPGRIVATGAPVRYQQQEQNGQEVKAEAARIEYDVIKGEVILIGDARLIRSHDTFSSDRIVYDRSQGVIKAGTSAQGRQRVRINIVPSASKKSASTTMQMQSQQEPSTASTSTTVEEVEQQASKPHSKNRSSKTSARSRNHR